MKRLIGGPLKSTSTSIAKEPKDAKTAACGCWISWEATAKAAGMTIAARAALFSEVSPGSAISSRGNLMVWMRSSVGGRPACG